MVIGYLKDKDPALLFRIGLILMISALLLPCLIYLKLHLGSGIPGPLFVINNDFIKGMLTGFSGTMLGLAVVLNILSIIKSRTGKQ